jgi:hypothetical protein
MTARRHNSELLFPTVTHLAGMAVQAALIPAFFFMDLLTVRVSGTALPVVVAIWQDRVQKPESSVESQSLTHQ